MKRDSEVELDLKDLHKAQIKCYSYAAQENCNIRLVGLCFCMYLACIKNY